jgi:hypothetical protein
MACQYRVNSSSPGTTIVMLSGITRLASVLSGSSLVTCASTASATAKHATSLNKQLGPDAVIAGLQVEAIFHCESC